MKFLAVFVIVLSLVAALDVSKSTIQHVRSKTLESFDEEHCWFGFSIETAPVAAVTVRSLNPSDATCGAKPLTAITFDSDNTQVFVQCDFANDTKGCGVRFEDALGATVAYTPFFVSHQCAMPTEFAIDQFTNVSDCHGDCSCVAAEGTATYWDLSLDTEPACGGACAVNGSCATCTNTCDAAADPCTVSTCTFELPAPPVTYTFVSVSDPETVQGVRPTCADRTSNFDWAEGLFTVFNVAAPISVTSLGAYDQGVDGISGANTNITVGLFDATGNTLLTAEWFGLGSSGTTDCGYMYKPIAPITLPIGTYMVGTVGFNQVDTDGYYDCYDLTPLNPTDFYTGTLVAANLTIGPWTNSGFYPPTNAETYLYYHGSFKFVEVVPQN